MKRMSVGKELSPEAKRLLATSLPLRRMTRGERSRAAAFLARIEKERPPSLPALGLSPFQQIAMGLAVLTLVLVVATPDGERETSNIIVPEVREPSLRRPAFARVPDESTFDTPGYHDVCGQRVCEQRPSCCEGEWDEDCDAELLELTRGGGLSSRRPVGRCYWHDREACPGCACPMYLKRRETFGTGSEPGVSLGYDGGTGCLRKLAPLLVELKWMCAKGYCEE